MQFYSRWYPQIFSAETAWIANNAAAQNIKLVIGLGDNVDGGGETVQWQNADSAVRALDGHVPYMMAIGNHDYDKNDPAARTPHTVNFNKYFGPGRYSGQAWYGGNYPAGSNENFYGTFEFNGQKYLVLVLEVFPRDVTLVWADGVLKANADKDVILVTHSYMSDNNNQRVQPGGPTSAMYFGCDADNDGEELWNKFVKNYKNIVMVVSGHIADGNGVGTRVDRGVNGNLVSQMLSDYQGYPNGGNGYVRILTIDLDNNQLMVKTFSPYLNQSMTDSNNQFTLQYK